MTADPETRPLPPALRQQRLLMRSEALRGDLARQWQALQGPVQVVDRGVEAARWLRDHPQWPLVAAALLVVWRPRRALRWGRRLWSAWRMGRRAWRWWTGT